MVAETFAGIAAFKAMFDIAKSMKDMNDANIRNEAVSKLWEQIFSAQTRYSEAIERVSELEKQLAAFEKWDAEKEKYELKEIYSGSFARSIKEEARAGEPPHLICANCYDEGKKRILQKSSAVHMTCPGCKTMIKFRDIEFPHVNYSPRG